jgi:4-hydroxy-3-polyprenylbenzoate decarboxylase
MKKLIVGMSGSSGAIYGIRLLEILKTISGVETHLVMSPHAKLNVGIETSHSAKYVEGLADEVHSNGNQAASISSGSFRTEGMVHSA